MASRKNLTGTVIDVRSLTLARWNRSLSEENGRAFSTEGIARVIVSGGDKQARQSLVSQLADQGLTSECALNFASADALLEHGEPRPDGMTTIVQFVCAETSTADITSADISSSRADNLILLAMPQDGEYRFDDVAGVLQELASENDAVPGILHRPRILVADDNAMNREMAAKQIAKTGVLCDTARNGHAALLLIDDTPYDLIFVDCLMPVIDGFQFAEKLRLRDPAAGGEIPVIALTGRGPDRVKERCLESGMDDLVSKPLALDQLLTILDKWLDGHGMTFFDLTA